MRTNDQPSGQLFPKRWSLSKPNRTKSTMNKHKMKHHRNSDTKNRQQRTTSEPPPWNALETVDSLVLQIEIKANAMS